MLSPLNNLFPNHSTSHQFRKPKDLKKRAKIPPSSTDSFQFLHLSARRGRSPVPFPPLPTEAHPAAVRSRRPTWLRVQAARPGPLTPVGHAALRPTRSQLPHRALATPRFHSRFSRPPPPAHSPAARGHGLASPPPLAAERSPRLRGRKGGAASARREQRRAGGETFHRLLTTQHPHYDPNLAERRAERPLRPPTSPYIERAAEAPRGTILTERLLPRAPPAGREDRTEEHPLHRQRVEESGYGPGITRPERSSAGQP